ncbi:hypothetical protein N7462_006306 [Penicillium macrosclerotiorum]|uniref:uncharacterized protein n=1 Tax=Penicillium macrosclerotiorum TaxID=303699 RepID=UPI0025497071|nr:uncharacterized protein N7462_006306 [Penicillium macrosclerotiorum]KAJ5683141.1 hypothetical protein N7462_006306 [Penicillium macrosclerotiorum]
MSDDMDEDYEAIMSSTSQQSYTTWAVIKGTLIDPRETGTKEQAIAHIDAIYESGTPFFTKRAIRALWDQLKTQTDPGDKIITRDLTGARIAWTVKLGKSINLIFGEDQEKEYFRPKLMLRMRFQCNLQLTPPSKESGVGYRSRASLKSSLHWFGAEDSAYEPLCLMYRILQIDPSSEAKSIIPDEEIPDRDMVAKDFREKRLVWEESEACQRLKLILASEVSSHDINKIVGLACGSLALPNNEKAAEQTALLCTVREWLKERDQTDGISSYIQDPMNTSVDREVLADIGFEMIDDPRGWLEIDERSVVLSVAPNVPVKEIIADTARPAVVIWNRVENDDKDSTDPDSPRVRKMMTGYKLLEFGDEETWSNVVIYTRISKVPPIPREDGTFQDSPLDDE